MISIFVSAFLLQTLSSDFGMFQQSDPFGNGMSFERKSGQNLYFEGVRHRFRVLQEQMFSDEIVPLAPLGETPDLRPELAHLDMPARPDDRESYPRALFRNVREVCGTPFHWKRNDWLYGGMWLGGLRAVAALDEPAVDFVSRHRSSSSSAFFHEVGRFGVEYSAVVVGGYWLGGKIFHSEKAALVARDSLTSSIIVSGLITPALKAAVGRERPSENNHDAFDLNAFGGGVSWPSGHTAQAFAVAGTIADHYDRRWIKLTSYGVATLVGISRMEANAHYLSDVIAGAFIGYWVSHKVTGKQKNGKRFRWEPYLGKDAVGVTINWDNR